MKVHKALARVPALAGFLLYKVDLYIHLETHLNEAVFQEDS